MTDVEAVKSRINIVDIVGEKVKLKKAGINYFGLCPFHSEKSPSFSVNEQLQIYKCFGCGQSGDIFEFVMKTNHYEFREALEELADRAGYKLQKTSSSSVDDKFAKEKDDLEKLNRLVLKFFQLELLQDDNAGKIYAKKRNLNQTLVKIFGVGYASDSSQKLTNYLIQSGYTKEYLVKSGISSKREGSNEVHDKFKNRLIFSIFDQKGKLVGFSGRYIGPDRKDFQPPKYLNSPETIIFNKSKTLFGLYQAQTSIRELKFAIVTEGQMNILSSHRAGVSNIVASLGTSFTDLHLDLLRRYTDNIYLAFDKDTAGKKAMLRTLEMIWKNKPEINCRIISWDSKLGKDPDEVINADQLIWVDAVNNPKDPIEYLIDEFEIKYENPGFEVKEKFVKTCIALLKSLKDSIKVDSYLQLLADRMGFSKSALADSLHKGTSNFDNQRHEVIAEPIKKVEKKKGSEIGDTIFAILLQNWDSTKHILLGIERDFIMKDYLELYDCLQFFVDESDLKDLPQSLDDETKELFERLMMKRINMDDNISSEEHILKNILQLLMSRRNELMQDLRDKTEDKVIDTIAKRLDEEIMMLRREKRVA